MLMKKFSKWIFSAALIAGLSISPMSADVLMKKDVQKGASSKATATMQATRAPHKSAKGNAFRGLDNIKTRSLSNGLSTEKKHASFPKGKRAIANAEGTYPIINGALLYSNDWNATGEAAVGLYTIPTSSTGSFDLMYLFPDGTNPNYGAAFKDGVYYYNYYYDLWGFIQYFESYGIDVETGEQVYYADNSSYPVLAMGMDTDPLTGEIYGIFLDAFTGELSLASVSYGAGLPQISTVAALDPEEWYNAFAIASDGTFYAIEQDGATGEGILVTLNRTTGAKTTIGATGQYPYYISGACIDRKSDRMFWALSPEDETGYLTEVNLETGVATEIAFYADGAEVAGMYVPAPAAADSAPAECTNVYANFSDDSLSGTVTFKAPTTCFNGDLLGTMGKLTITLLVNGAVEEQVQVSPGTEGSFNVTVPNAGSYTFVVYASNASGDGPRTTIKNVWIGADTPAATRATAQYANGNMEISWLPVTEGINGGYIGDVTYMVKDAQGSILADGLTVTNFSFALPMPESITAYYYEVYVVAGTLVSAPARTNTVTLGSIIPPYVADFTANGLDGWTIIDGNNDGKIWTVQADGSIRMTYNSSVAMDDWLIMPPMKLEAGKAYELSFTAHAQSTTYPERLEVCYGTSANVEDLTNVILPPTTINALSAAPQEFSEMISPATDGIYFIGFHGISDADEYYLYLNDIQIAAGVSALAPGLATNLVATPDATGALKCTVSFNAPDKTMQGGTLSSLTKVELYRGETLINTFTAPAPGAALSYTDNLTTGGNVTYTVVGYNAEGAGLRATTSAFIGFDLPVAPEYVNIVTTDVEGQVLLTWAAVTQDVNGLPLTANDVTYTVAVYDGAWLPVAEGITATQYSYQAVAAGEQDFVQMAVFPATSAGVGSGTASEMIPVGTPYDGLNETFEDGQLHYIWGYMAIPTGANISLNIGTDSTFSDLQSANGDNGYIYINANYLDYGAGLFTGLVSLEGTVNPALTFYTYNVSNDVDPDINEVTVSVREAGAEDWTEVMGPTAVCDLVSDVNTWGRVTVPLTAYANKTVQIMLTGVTKFYTNTFFDDIMIGSLLDYNLAINKVSAPSKVNAGQEYTVNVAVANLGANNAASYSVDLYADGQIVGSKNLENLASGANVNVAFTLTMSPIATQPVNIYAVVNFSQDQDIMDNYSDTITVTPVVSALPTPTDLSAAQEGACVELSWTAPNLEGGVAQEITEDFEDADGVTDEYGDWKFVDVDGSPVGGFQNMDIPGITPGTTLGSFWIWDNDIIGGNQTFEAHSGVKYLFALFRYDDGTSDDWAISPKLFGGAQTISFYAKSYSTQYPEKISVYYSTGGLEVEDFIMVEGSTVNSVPGDWTEYEAALPEGAMYFAIRSYATGSFMLMVDDVTYTPADSVADLELAGYNVYRNGEQINDALVTTTSYVDTPEEDGEYTYVVTAVYTDRGASAASNSATVMYDSSASGIDAINGVNVSVENRTIVIRNAEGLPVTVANAAGIVVYNGVAENTTYVTVTEGVYVVKVDKKVRKVIVK